MITPVEEERLQQHERARHRSTGPAFSVPDLGAAMPSATIGVGTISSGACFAASEASPPGSSVAQPDLSGFLGRSVGSGQCVALVQQADPSVGLTSSWSPGAQVSGNTTLAPGTPIATFDGSHRYANATDGSSHAAIYLGQDAQGIQVMDQWIGKAASVRTIPWSNPGGAPADTGTAYRVVQSRAT